jgi:gluconolactonase
MRHLPGLPLLAIALLTTHLQPVSSQTSSAKFVPTIGRIIRADPRLDRLISRDAKIEVLASGMKFAEGPVWIKEGGYLLFSDVPRNSS